MDMLSDKIASQYDLKGLKPGIVSVGGVEYDLRTISLDRAEKLVAAGFKNLVKKASSAPEAEKKK